MKLIRHRCAPGRIRPSLRNSMSELLPQKGVLGECFQGRIRMSALLPLGWGSGTFQTIWGACARRLTSVILDFLHPRAPCPSPEQLLAKATLFATLRLGHAQRAVSAIYSDPARMVFQRTCQVKSVCQGQNLWWMSRLPVSLLDAAYCFPSWHHFGIKTPVK